MNDLQQRATAVAFLHALQNSAELYNEWMSIPKDDDKAIGALVQRTLGLAQAPDCDDLHAMARYVDAELQTQVASFQQSNPNAPRHVGVMFLMQQNS